jgi:hypothetical protein
MSEIKTHVVFKPLASLLDVIDIAEENRWPEVQRFKRGERQLQEVIYELPDGETVLRGIDDHFVVVTYAVITGPMAAEVEEKLRRGGETLEEATLWQWTTSDDPAERAFALRAFAAISQESASPRIVSLYSDAVADDDPAVRAALIEAVGRAAWPELWPVVDAIAKAETPEAVVLKEGYELHLPRSRAS